MKSNYTKTIFPKIALFMCFLLSPVFANSMDASTLFIECELMLRAPKKIGEKQFYQDAGIVGKLKVTAIKNQTGQMQLTSALALDDKFVETFGGKRYEVFKSILYLLSPIQGWDMKEVQEQVKDFPSMDAEETIRFFSKINALLERSKSVAGAVAQNKLEFDNAIYSHFEAAGSENSLHLMAFTSKGIVAAVAGFYHIEQSGAVPFSCVY